MPDGLHPKAAGNDIMAGCLGPLIAQLVALPVTDFSATRRLLMARHRCPLHLHLPLHHDCGPDV